MDNKLKTEIKMLAGVRDITIKAATIMRFVLASPELTSISSCEISVVSKNMHRELSLAFLKRQDGNMDYSYAR